jgi:hypothetical protein
MDCADAAHPSMRNFFNTNQKIVGFPLTHIAAIKYSDGKHPTLVCLHFEASGNIIPYRPLSRILNMIKVMFIYLVRIPQPWDNVSPSSSFYKSIYIFKRIRFAISSVVFIIPTTKV